MGDNTLGSGEIVVEARNNGTSLKDIARTGVAIATDLGGVEEHAVRNVALKRAGDDLGGEQPTLGPFLREAEYFGDSSNNKSTTPQSGLSGQFNRFANSTPATLLTMATPAGGALSAATDLVNSDEKFGNALGDAAASAVRSVPLVGGVISGVIKGDTDVREVKRGIDYLSQKGVPGFRSDEFNIDGHNVRVRVSAADTLTGSDTQPWVNIEAHGIGKKDPRVQAVASNVVGAAMSDLDAFTTRQYSTRGDDFASDPRNIAAALREEVRNTTQPQTKPAETQSTEYASNKPMTRILTMGVDAL